MNRAEQTALFHTANLGILEIRQAEINFYVNMNTVFGINSSLVAGFTYGILTQSSIDYGNQYVSVVKALYYIMSAVTIASSLHVILCTMLIQVYGPGLALNGPLGSMTRAAEGMRTEQDQIIIAVAIEMVGFVLSTLWLFWTVMTFRQALASSVAFVTAIYFWYYYCERIYLKFYWEKKKDSWDEASIDGSGNDFSFDNADPTAVAACALEHQQQNRLPPICNTTTTGDTGGARTDIVNDDDQCGSGSKNIRKTTGSSFSDFDSMRVRPSTRIYTGKPSLYGFIFRQTLSGLTRRFTATVANDGSKFDASSALQRPSHSNTNQQE